MVTRFTRAQTEKAEAWRSGTHRYTQASDAIVNGITFCASSFTECSSHLVSFLFLHHKGEQHPKERPHRNLNVFLHYFIINKPSYKHLQNTIMVPVV